MILQSNYNGAVWGSLWSISGNGLLNSISQFLGLTNNKSLRFRTNNIDRISIDSLTGNVTIGATGTLIPTATSTLLINGSLATAVLTYGPLSGQNVLDSSLIIKKGLILLNSSGGNAGNGDMNIKVNLPMASTSLGRVYTFKVTNYTGKVSIIAAGTELIESANTYTGLTANYKVLKIQSNGTKWLIIGNKI